MVEKKKTKKKSTNVIYEKRVMELCPLVSFLSRHEIMEYVRNSTDWDVKRAQIDNYIKEAKKTIESVCEERKKSIRSDAYNNYVNLFKKSFMIEDYRTCLSIQTRIDSIFGMDQRDKAKVEININEKSITEEMNAEDASRKYAEALKGE